MDSDCRRSLHKDLSRLRGAAVIATAVVALAAASVHPSAGASPSAGVIPGMAPNLTGGMASRRYLIGTWTCTSRITAAVGTSTSTEPVVVSFMTAPNDTLGAWARALAFSAAAFYGYSASSKSWWISATDNSGARVFETSKGGSVFVGTVTTAGGIKTIRDTWTKMSDARFTTVTEIQDKGVWRKSAEHACAKG